MTRVDDDGVGTIGGGMIDEYVAEVPVFIAPV